MKTKKKSIIIIDDEKDVVDVCKEVLESEGYKVDYALDGKVGIKKCLNNDYDLILLDIMLPGIDGWEIIELLKMNPKTKDIPIAMITAKTEFKSKLLGIQQGAIDYITKPFTPTEIAFRIKRILY